MPDDSSPLPFPELLTLLPEIMAREPNAPHTRRELRDRAAMEVTTREKPTFDDVEQVLRRLKDSGQVVQGYNKGVGLHFWKLTTAGKLNQGIS